MEIWDILDLEPTTKTSDIKKAYAKKLKIHHPEDDPEGYQRLREAYDTAIKYAKQYAKTNKEENYRNKFDLNNYEESNVIERIYEEKIDSNNENEQKLHEDEQLEDRQEEKVEYTEQKDLKYTKTDREEDHRNKFDLNNYEESNVIERIYEEKIDSNNENEQKLHEDEQLEDRQEEKVEYTEQKDLKYTKTDREEDHRNKFDLNNYEESNVIEHIYEEKIDSNNENEQKLYEDEQLEDRQRKVEYTEQKDLKEVEKEKLINELKLNYEDFFKRIEITTWANIFNTSKLMWNIDDSYLLNRIIIDFIKENHFFPKKVLHFFDKTFKFNENKDNLYRIFGKDDIDYLLKDLNNNLEVDYIYLSECKDIDYDEFLKNVESGREALENNNYSKAGYYLSKAETICKGEPYTCKLLAKYNIEEKHFEDAQEYIKIYSELRKDDIDIIYYRGLLQFYMENHAEALRFFERASMEGYNSLEFLIKLGTCYFYLKDLQKAKYIFEKVIKIDSGNKIALNYLRLIEEQSYKVKNKISTNRRRNFKGLSSFIVIAMVIILKISANASRIDKMKDFNFSKQNVEQRINDKKTIVKNNNLMTVHVTNLVQSGVCIIEKEELDSSGNKVKKEKWMDMDRVKNENLGKMVKIILIGEVNGKKTAFFYPCFIDGSCLFSSNCDLKVSEKSFYKDLVSKHMKDSILKNKDVFMDLENYYDVNLN